MSPLLARIALVLAASGCAPQLAQAPPRTAPVAAPSSRQTTAAALGVAPTSFIPPANAAAALAAFRKSCPALRQREDRSGLTQPGDWDAACAAADTATDAARFFTDYFTAVTIAAGSGFATGYFEPEIAGSRTPDPLFPVPIYRRPPDLVEVDLGAFVADLKGRKLRGRVAGTALVPYHDRAAIMAGALAERELELAWAADPYEAFFLEIQGSGRLRLPDGSVMRIGYASQNGRDYVPIGRVLVERGELPKGGASMPAILAWLRANPGKAPALLAANPSTIFFRETTGTRPGDGPIGAMGVPVTPNVSVAADPAFIPLGAPLFVETALPGATPLAALMIAQDTGGAIKGANRIDLFRSSAAEAGGLAAAARVVILLPRRP
jgi:membrane-bound lytic murein transglycosylase A